VEELISEINKPYNIFYEPNEKDEKDDKEVGQPPIMIRRKDAVTPFATHITSHYPLINVMVDNGEKNINQEKTST
jgi:curved DNA-binding protein CbpA